MWTKEERKIYYKNYHSLIDTHIEPKAKKRERLKMEYEKRCNKYHIESFIGESINEVL